MEIKSPDETLYSMLFEHAAVGMTQVSLEGRFVKVNKALCDFLGYSRKEFLECTFQDITHPDYLRGDLENVQRLLDGKADKYTMEKIYQHKAGHFLWGKLTVSIVRDVAGEPLFFISVVENIQDKKVADFSLLQSEQKFKKIVELLSDKMAVWITANKGKQVLFVNRGFANIWQLSPLQLTQNPLRFVDAIEPTDKTNIQKLLNSSPYGRLQAEFKLNIGDTVKSIEFDRFDIFDEDGVVRSQVFVAQDRSEEIKNHLLLKSQNARLKKLAKQDSLTGINNRYEIFRCVQQEYKRALRHDLKATLVFIDLNDFKSINDKFGHIAGDEALKCFARHLCERIRDSDKLGRYGGDEFLLLLPETSEKEAQVLVSRLNLDAVSCKSQDGQHIPITCSVGMCELSEDIESIERWLEQADGSMYEEKQQSSE